MNASEPILPSFSPAPPDGNLLLQVEHLKKYFPLNTNFFGRPASYLRAVDDVSFDVVRGTTVGIVGESGCGKTTMGRTIMRLYSVTGGKVIFDGTDLAALSSAEIRRLRPQLQMIFQDPYSSLSPRMPVGEIIGEAVKVHKIVPKADYRDYILEVMQECGLPRQYYDRYPHEFSGGQRQRICIARSLALQPRLVICDEPVSALDVSIQAQIINLLKELQEKQHLTYIFISHDLSVVRHISDRVGVMYLGSLVEYADVDALFEHPLHPYTEALLSAAPHPDPDYKSERKILKGDIPSPADPPSGCKFHTRCEYCTERCTVEAPAFREAAPGHFVACHRVKAEGDVGTDGAVGPTASDAASDAVSNAASNAASGVASGVALNVASDAVSDVASDAASVAAGAETPAEA